MKKLLPLFFLFISVFCPLSSFAAAPTLNLALFSENHNSQTDKFSWNIIATTTDIPNNTSIYFYLYGSDGKQIGERKIEKISNGNASYLSGHILDPLTTYRVTAVIVNPNLTATFTQKTPEGTGTAIIVNGNGNTAIGGGTQNNDPNPVEVKGQENTDKEKSSVYRMLAPIGNLKCFGDEEGCIKDNIGEYFNVLFKLAIGLCGALAVVMIVIGGVQYMGDESVFSKTQAKERIYSAILGLIIALGSYALLNTINPDLLGGGGVNIKQVSAEIVDFTISGGATFDGKAIAINFNKEAYPAAKIASQKTGVETAFILAMFAQESGSGANTGSCNYQTANMQTGQLESLKTVANRLKLDYTKINMSCSGGGSSHGGAIGYTQFLPGTWLEYANQAKQILGHEPNPWNASDALMMTGLFLKKKGGAGSNENNQMNAACAYFGSCTGIVSCGNGINGTYGQCILGKKVSIQKQIEEAIKKGEIKP